MKMEDMEDDEDSYGSGTVETTISDRKNFSAARNTAGGHGGTSNSRKSSCLFSIIPSISRSN